LGKNVIEITGCLPAGWPPLERFVALEDPVRYATTVLSEAMKARGIDVVGGIDTCAAPPLDLVTIATHEGATMAEILREVNKPSHNARAEMLLRLLGLQKKSEGSVAAGRQAALEFLAAQKVDTAGWELQDGSGMSRTDLVTAAGLSRLLAAMHQHPHAAVFRDSLPIAGVDGTLKQRLRGKHTEGRIRAKTGRLQHTSGLAGYAEPRRGGGYAFAILVNHATAPAGAVHDAIDAIAAALVTP
jgi:D-alanyl-D-alanine carboxypeptidase/D-alanyl-D-alanine-endopeptidase (penicillin-binding protein 4)